MNDNAEDSTDVVERLYTDLSALAQALVSSSPSLAVSVTETASKALLLAAASRFETEFGEMFEAIAGELGANCLAQFAINQGVKRKFHTLFDWDSANANKLFSLFGQDFKRRAAARVSVDQDFAVSMAQFMKVGRNRNLLVHSDFAAYPLEFTLDELIAQYRQAREFLPIVRSLLLEDANVTA